MSKTIEEVILEKGFYVTRPKGTSMFPMLKDNCNEICVVKADEINKYDVPLYKRESGEYVLHRILDINEDGYVCCGDNQWTLEYGVKREQIIGKLDRWFKGNKEYTVSDKSYQRYVKLWCKSLKRRHFILWFWHRYNYLVGAIKEILSKIFKRNKS